MLIFYYCCCSFYFYAYLYYWKLHFLSLETLISEIKFDLTWLNILFNKVDRVLYIYHLNYYGRLSLMTCINNCREYWKEVFCCEQRSRFIFRSDVWPSRKAVNLSYRIYACHLIYYIINVNPLFWLLIWWHF